VGLSESVRAAVRLGTAGGTYKTRIPSQGRERRYPRYSGLYFGTWTPRCSAHSPVDQELILTAAGREIGLDYC
jgi:hypothetical protein